ncbi:DUF4870 domain-containing protein [Microcella flavibacter]|uniref:DUF4870 domain-containing protein n=1 Tax=Microcella flavibacter TaxID=1804990 RepID=UPI001E460F1F|nr:DUF4870 domain-containing protein [Microcella flavibacter]
MTDQPPANPYSSSPVTMRPEDEKLWSILTHVGGIVVFLIVPLVAYLVLRERGPFVRHHTGQALNFQLTMLIVYVVGFITSWIGVGFLLILAAGILSLVFGIIAAIAASRGEFYRYPLAIPFTR